MELLLIRHGQSTGNGRAIFMGWSDHPLTEAGRAQARAAARRLASLGPMPVVCSDLSRARATAEIIAAGWGDDVVIPDARWREAHCGDYEDQPWDILRQNAALSAQFDRDPLNAVMPGGESIAMMSARVVGAFANLAAMQAERLAIVTHDGPIRAVLAHCLGLPAERYWTLATSHGGITQLKISESWITVQCINDCGHLLEVPDVV